MDYVGCGPNPKCGTCSEPAMRILETSHSKVACAVCNYTTREELEEMQVPLYHQGRTREEAGLTVALEKKLQNREELGQECVPLSHQGGICM